MARHSTLARIRDTYSKHREGDGVGVREAIRRTAAELNLSIFEVCRDLGFSRKFAETCEDKWRA